MRSLLLTAALVLSAPMFCVAFACAQAADSPGDSCTAPTPIRFAPGHDSATYSDVVTRSGPRCYVFTARKGQRLDASLTRGSSSNAAVLAFRPGWGFRDVYGYRMMDGDALPGAGRDDTATSVRATLPESGRYLVELATARGDAAAYTLRIRIR